MSQAVVRAVELSRMFGSFRAVDRVSFEVSAGEIFGFLGSNGAGKTTTIRMLCGLLAPTSGHGEVLGLDIARQATLIKHRIGYMSQRFSLYTDLTVDENLAFWGGAYNLVGAQLARRLAWAHEIAELTAYRHMVVRNLPPGVRQRLALVAALLHEPAVVFLDEPTSGVDPEARRRFWDLLDTLATNGTTVFVTTHAMDEAERCGRVALMHAGRLLALDTVPNLKAKLAPGTVVEITCPRAAEAMHRLERLAGVREIALFGERLRAVLAAPEAASTLAGTLVTAGHTPAQIVPLEPSLEEVFIHVISEQPAGRSPNAGHRMAGSPL